MRTWMFVAIAFILFESQASALQVGPEFEIAASASTEKRSASVAPLHGGGFVVVWNSSSDVALGNINGRIYSSAGVPIGGKFVGPTALGKPHVVWLRDGFVVAWVGGSGSLHVFAQRYNAVGATIGRVFQIDSVSPPGLYHPWENFDISGLKTGGFVIVWKSEGTQWSLWARRYTAFGTALGPEFLIDTTDWQTIEGLRPVIAWLRDGGFVVSWQLYELDHFMTFGIYAQRYDAAGAPVGSRFRVNSHTAGDQSDPSIVGLATGGYVITWRSSGQDGSGSGIYGQYVDAANTLAGGEFRVNSEIFRDQTEPSVASLATGGFVVTFTSAPGYILLRRYRGWAGWAPSPAARVVEPSLHEGVQSHSATTQLFGNGFVVIWSSVSGNGASIHGQRYE